MIPMLEKPIAYEAYQALAEHYAAGIDTSLMHRPGFLCVKAKKVDEDESLLLF